MKPEIWPQFSPILAEALQGRSGGGTARGAIARTTLHIVLGGRPLADSFILGLDNMMLARRLRSFRRSRLLSARPSGSERCVRAWRQASAVAGQFLDLERYHN